MTNKIKVLIVDDASFMVKALRGILEPDPEIEIVGTAKNGKDALEKIKQLQPDVVTLDVDMPIMDGISTVRHIMIESPVPIVMLSSLFSHGDITFEALRLGVVDFLPKPSGAISRDIHEQGDEIIERVKIAAAENIENVRRTRITKFNINDSLTERYGYRTLDHVVAIGTTLGGPNTIIRIMSELSPELPAAVIAIQEIAPDILPAFVKEFNEYTPWKVDVGREGTVLEAGTCYISSYHEPMVIKINDNHEPYLSAADTTISKPINALFSSAAEVFDHNTVGLLLTGVGTDGHEGFAQIKHHSGVTIAQKVETCVYPNLTRCAIEKNVVDLVVDAGDLTKQVEVAIFPEAKADKAALSK